MSAQLNTAGSPTPTSNNKQCQKQRTDRQTSNVSSAKHNWALTPTIINRYKAKWTDRQGERRTDMHQGGQTDRHTPRHADRQTDRETKAHHTEIPT